MRYIQHPKTLELIPSNEYVAPFEHWHFIMGDIKPYRSMIDGSIITSRSKHRAHLKSHGCIEVGNETKHLMDKAKPITPPKGLKDTIIRVVNERNWK